MARKPKQESVTAIPKTAKYVKGPDTEPTPVNTNTRTHDHHLGDTVLALAHQL